MKLGRNFKRCFSLHLESNQYWHNMWRDDQEGILKQSICYHRAYGFQHLPLLLRLKGALQLFIGRSAHKLGSKHLQTSTHVTSEQGTKVEGKEVEHARHDNKALKAQISTLATLMT
ncbi:hypothetical protein CR513_15189, partial [Mucuna pruriens]